MWRSDMETLRLDRVTDEATLARLETALRALGAELSDPFPPQRDVLRRALFGPHPSAFGLLAVRGEALLGAALFSPVYSTARGGAGAYVSDLWVAPGARGLGIGRRLLAAVAEAGTALWGSDWLKLAVYDHSTESQAFYRRLGFCPAQGVQEMRLDAAGVAALPGRAG